MGKYVLCKSYSDPDSEFETKFTFHYKLSDACKVEVKLNIINRAYLVFNLLSKYPPLPLPFHSKVQHR